MFEETNEIVPCSINIWSFDIIRGDWIKRFYYSEYTYEWFHQSACISIFWDRFLTSVWMDFWGILSVPLCRRFNYIWNKVRIFVCCLSNFDSKNSVCKKNIISLCRKSLKRYYIWLMLSSCPLLVLCIYYITYVTLVISDVV